MFLLEGISYILLSIAKLSPTTASEKPGAESLPKLGQWPLFVAVIRLLRQAQRKLKTWLHTKLRIFNCFICYFSIVATDVWEHFSPSLESAGVIPYKFLKAFKMSFHLIDFAILSLEQLESFWGFSCKFVSAFEMWSILITKTSEKSRCIGWNEPLDWTSDACT